MTMMTPKQVRDILSKVDISYDDFCKILNANTVSDCIHQLGNTHHYKIDRLFVDMVHPRLNRDEKWSLKTYDSDPETARSICHYLIENNGIDKESFLALMQTHMVATCQWANRI